MGGLRITTWNVNGIRNPFGYQPWRDKRSFEAMFEILEADIIIFQETKIQRKDLSDDMVLVRGWDCYFSLPKHKKGYSGVVIYTRQSTCCPIRAEEGLTGSLCPPNSSVPFRDLPNEKQIGGYPTAEQLAASPVDAATLDSEGRCVILEFPAFVLIGVYCPANRDETRDDFRLGFLDLMDARVRNLIAMGKQVFLTGDLNISREEMDTANAESSMKKQGLTGLEYASTPARRLFNQLLEGGKVFGQRDEGREQPVMWDICRAFHPSRQGMFTCWEQKTNARPANCGARIDYVLCSSDMIGWFSDSNIQEGLMGSDHCPVYAIIKDTVATPDGPRSILDIVNPPGMFQNGKRLRGYSATTDPLPTSGKLIPEFFGRRSIRDMFSRKPSLLSSQTSTAKELDVAATSESLVPKVDSSQEASKTTSAESKASSTSTTILSNSPSKISKKKRESSNASSTKANKKAKPNDEDQASPPPLGKGQQSLKGFFKPKTPLARKEDPKQGKQQPRVAIALAYQTDGTAREVLCLDQPPTQETTKSSPTSRQENHALQNDGAADEERVHDPVEAKESWSKLFTKPAAPRCEGHEEPCICLLTKKAGVNLGRSFWMCPRPLGPTGAKETNTQWRCHTFIWCSDWNSANKGPT